MQSFPGWVKNEIYVYRFLLVVVVPFEIDPRRVYGMGPAFRPLPEGALILTFWNHMQDGQRCFLNFRDVLEKTPPSCKITLNNKEKLEGTKSEDLGNGWFTAMFLISSSYLFPGF